MKTKLYDIQWRKDDMGEYWVANFEDGEGNRGVTGNYYDREVMPEDMDQEEPFVPSPIIEDLIGKLELALRYLEHPDVEAMNFALGTEVVAKRIRKSIAKARGE